MGLLSRAQAPQAQMPMQGAMQQSDPMGPVMDMLRQQGFPVDSMPPQQLQALVMQVLQQGQPR